MILVLQQKGYTKIYVDPSEYGIGYPDLQHNFYLVGQ